MGRMRWDWPDTDVFITDNIGRFREWERGTRIFWDTICSPIRAGDAKLPKYVWNSNIKTDRDMIAQINPKTRECRCFDIRKLTPRETGRLMGVQEWALDRMLAVAKDYPNDQLGNLHTSPKQILSSSSLYKLFGNSIVVDVMVALFRQIWFRSADGGSQPRQLTLFPEPEWPLHMYDGHTLRLVELCAGYGSQALALDALQREYPELRYELTAWAEFDPESRKPLDQQPAVVAHRLLHPHAGPNLGDMTKIDWKKFMEYGFEEEETENAGQEEVNGTEKVSSAEIPTRVLSGRDIRGAEGNADNNGVGLRREQLYRNRIRLTPGDIDLLTYSTPCQSISQAGKRAGIAKGSGTRSSILWNTADAIEALRPKILMQENVAALVNQENKPHFDQWRGVLSDLGYDSDYRVLNAKDFGVPQNRERVFCLSWRRDMGLPHAFPWPQPVPLTRTIADVLEPDADPRYFLRPESVTAFLQKNESEQMIYVTTDHKPTGAEIDHILYEHGVDGRHG